MCIFALRKYLNEKLIIVKQIIYSVMKRFRFSYLVMFVAAVVLFGSCKGLKKMVDRADDLKKTVTPSPLEMHGEVVKFKIAGTIPPKYFDKKAILVTTPVLKYGSAEKSFKTYTLQGEKVKDNNDKVIPYKKGGTFSYEVEFPYEDAMRVSDLSLKFEASRGTEKADPVILPLAKGINVTPRLVKYASKIDGLQLVNMTVKKSERITSLQKAVILYDLQKANLKKSQANKEDVKKLIEFLTTTKDDGETELLNVEVSSYASPDGPEDLNAELVTGRGNAAQKFLEKKLKKAVSEKAKNASFLVKETTPSEDWAGFKKEVEASNVKDKELILRVLSMYSDPVVREREIKNISEVYTYLKDDVLPALRRSEIVANYQSKVKTDEELTQIANSGDITKLSVKELLYTASIVKDASVKEKLYKEALNQHANCVIAYNNLGVLKGQTGDIDAAKANFEKAYGIKSSVGAVLNNLGAIALAQGNLEEAEKYFTEAKSNSLAAEELGYNMGIINIVKGEYPQAVQNFGSKSTFGKALAQTLNKENEGAESTLNTVGKSECGWFYYLKAIVNAKLDKKESVFTNLNKAVDINSDIKEYAKGDVEFVKYWDKNKFKKIVE